MLNNLPKDMPLECQNWVRDFQNDILVSNIARIAHTLCMMGVSGKPDDYDLTQPADDPLGWIGRNQELWNQIIIGLIPQALRRQVKAYIAKDMRSINKSPDMAKYGDHFLKEWSAWVLTQL